MPSLRSALEGRDLGFLHLVAESWGVAFEAPDARVGQERLAEALLDAELLDEVLDALPPEARAALDDLLRHGGRLPWVQFTRHHGEVRAMGPARRDRERPDLHPASPAEVLWYRALLGRAFLEGERGPEEFAYIPDEFLAILPEPPAAETPGPPGRPATAAERAHPRPVSDRILENATTLLAGLRLGLTDEALASADEWLLPPAVLRDLLTAAGLLSMDGTPQPSAVRNFLEAPRAQGVQQLARTWLHSADFNDLRHVPTLHCEGVWRNDPLQTRQAVLDLLSTVPPATWWSLESFVAAVRERAPDFQRPAGDYDSWYLRDAASGASLRGFEHWDAVDGALLRWMIRGPLHALGFLDLAAPSADAPAAAFRLSDWAHPLLRGQAPPLPPVEARRLRLRSDGRIAAPPGVPCAVRYQVARFGLWEPPQSGTYHYRLSAASLARARAQGLEVHHLLTLLRRHAASVPPNLVRALTRWAQQGAFGRVETVTVLRLPAPEALEALRRSPAARFLEEPLGPTLVRVKPGAEDRVRDALLEMGYFVE